MMRADFLTALTRTAFIYLLLFSTIIGEIWNWFSYCGLTVVIQFHDTLHRFHTARGAGTASLKAKLLLQLMTMREEVLYDIYLDLHQAYDALDRNICLGISGPYGVGPRAICLL